MNTTSRPLVKRALLQAIKSVALIMMLTLGLLASTSIRAAGGSITKSSFGKTADGAAVDEYTLTNSNKVEAKIITYGGILTSLKGPDRNGNWADIVLGFDNVSDYEAKSPYFGAIIGRYGNRIGKAAFSLDGKDYKLTANNGDNT